jgi:hypothetical protein
MPSRWSYQRSNVDGCLELAAEIQSDCVSAPSYADNLFLWEGIAEGYGHVSNDMRFNAWDPSPSSAPVKDIAPVIVDMDIVGDSEFLTSWTAQTFDKSPTEVLFDLDELCVSSAAMDDWSFKDVDNDAFDAAKNVTTLRSVYPLSLSEERRLSKIAMASYQPPSSPTSDSHEPIEDKTSTPSEVAKTTLTRKRKSLAGSLSQSKKKCHNQIEKRYRTHINDKLVDLKSSVPSRALWVAAESKEASSLPGEEQSAKKDGKAAIITNAVEYIVHLESTVAAMQLAAITLTARVAELENRDGE